MERRNEAMVMRKSKWQYSPTPRVLQLPRRHSVRRSAAKGLKTTPFSLSQKDRGVKLEVLFHQERTFDRGTSFAMVNYNGGEEKEEEGRRRGKVADGREIGGTRLSSSSSTAVDEKVEEAKWRFQAEMLRSECNLLRIEKEIALKKMERRKKRMEKTLRSAVLTLLSGKQRISEGTKESKPLEDEISYLVEKLNELKSPKVKDVEARNCRHNFDKKASVLRKELERFDESVSEEVCVKGIQKMAEASFSVHSDQISLRNNNGNIDTLSSKMEALSKGVLLERMEKEYGSSLFAPSSVSKCIDRQDASLQDMYSKAIKAHEEKKDCSRQCKAVMRKIADEVRAEAEQWSQMQEMLNQVRKEMEELQSCRDFWQNRALESDSQLQNLHSSVEGWRRKALSSETKLKNLQAEVCGLQEEIKRLRKEDKLEPEKNKLPSESEKRVLICRLKENRHSNNGDWSKHSEGRTMKPSSSRPPLREVKNNSSVTSRHRNSSVMKM
ncbi:PREDICTED: nucleoprotein TPR-like [Camelina sativa]|uniref:Nucleoprotein TPR-like n=1 Tax=Camelina sativa TaxID=90675 RepID=A0ABM0YGY1_CAMSA|nr:PREDICTED: nucleoprotein TPR-like [Camelina sativa]